MDSLAFDMGGTFTDIVRVHSGQLHILKISTRLDASVQAVRDGIMPLVPEAPQRILHGTTLSTNTLLERKGARTALFATKGFEDVIEIGRQTRPLLYDIQCTRPPPLVPKGLRIGIHERCLAQGKCEKVVEREEIRQAARSAKKKETEAVAVCFLHSPLNPSNEKKAAEEIRRAGFHCSLSHEVAQVQGEYERTVATVANAYLLPGMSGYLKQMAEVWPDAEIRIMQSNGGLLSAESASLYPVQTVLSGPAAGVMGAFYVARAAGLNRIITFDMGGTSTDVCLCDGEIQWTEEMEVGGLPLPIPMIDIVTVGSGGGSVARVDSGGALRVGPESAGAVPGPVCYAQGGVRPTLTDAHVYLGRIQPDRFLGGTRSLETRNVPTAFLKLARRAKMQSVHAALGVVEVANTVMEGALRKVSVERGFDPRDFSLISFGGAGGLHACDLALRLGIPEVMVPLNPGLLCAIGLLLADVIRDRSVGILKTLGKDINLEQIRRTAARIQKDLRVNLVTTEEIRPSAVQTHAYAILRYKGQASGLSVPIVRNLVTRFHEEHRKRYGFSRLHHPIEVVRIQVRGIGRQDRRLLSSPALFGPDERYKSGKPSTRKLGFKDKRPVRFKRRVVKTPFIERAFLKPGDRLQGPAVISEYSSTTVIPAGLHVRVDDCGNLRIACR